MANHLKSIVRDNVLKIMAKMPDRDTPTKLSKKCYWPRGKRAGKKVAARTVGYLFESDEKAVRENFVPNLAIFCLRVLQFVARVSSTRRNRGQAKGTSGPSL